jgi:hypothetical protein
MPTPDDEAMVLPVEHESIAGRPTCPPEESRIIATHELNEPRGSTHDSNASSMPHVPMQQPTPSPQNSREHTQAPDDIHTKLSSTDVDSPNRDIPTPMTATDDGTEEQRTSHVSPLSTAAPASLLASHLSSPFPAHRVCHTRHACTLCARCTLLITLQFLPNTSSSLLRPGSRFVGTQTSDRQKYDVEVEIKHVDMRESFMCGYLRIKGAHPPLWHHTALAG